MEEEADSGIEEQQEAADAEAEKAATEAEEKRIANEENKEALAHKDALAFQLIPGEELIMTRRPSLFAFISMHAFAIVVLGAHLVFNWLRAQSSESWIMEIVIDAVSSDLGRGIGFPILMIIIAWVNRWINITTSGRWFTSLLMLIAVMPLLLWIHDVAVPSDKQLGFLPESYPYVVMGFVWTGLLIVFTFYFQRSFHYGVTSDAVIFKRSFMLSRSQRRILYDNINEMDLKQGALGTIFGFGTVMPMTSSGLGVGEDSAGIEIGGGGGGSSPGFFGFLKIALSAQRSASTVRPDPSICFYRIRKPEDVKMKVNEMQKSASMTGLMREE